MECDCNGAAVKGWFFNGEEHENSIGGTFENGSLILDFDTYASVLKATLKDGSLDGGFPSQGSGELYKKETDEFTAQVERSLGANQAASR